ncbi:hypothetical protein BJV77DRAFT_970057 [Russula vinacea]|nr:hypothetical protein BJV77DRAFT_970057 [Russula vinacea]
MEYQVQVEQDYGNIAAAPAWFEPAFALATAGINDRLDIMTNRLNVIGDTIYNSLRHDGTWRAYEVVPFLNGDLPTQAPHLDPQEATAYLTGYGVGYVHYIAEQKRRIGLEIGCPVEIPDIQV